MIDDEKKEVVNMLSQIRRSIILLENSILNGERFTREYWAFLAETNNACTDLECRLGVKEKIKGGRSSKADEWPLDQAEIWEARR